MRSRPERRAAFSAFAALALGAVAMVFERAGPSVLSADPDEFRSWTRAHHDALIAQSVVFGVSTAPLLLFFAGLQAVLRQQTSRSEAGFVDLSLVVLGGGALWVIAQLVGQAIQVSMAMAAAHGEPAGFVASLGNLMKAVQAFGNVPLAAALGACAVAGFRHGPIPRWLAWLSTGTAVTHLLPVAATRVSRGPLSADGPGAYLSYPVFVGWMVAMAVSLLRRGRAPRRA